MAAPAVLSALAAVAQGTIPGYAHEAAHKAILQVDLEHTRMALERARTQGEDDRQKYTKRINALQRRLDYQMIHMRDLHVSFGSLIAFGVH